jgi:hypothetical protein
MEVSIMLAQKQKKGKSNALWFPTGIDNLGDGMAEGAAFLRLMAKTPEEDLDSGT